MSERFPVTNKNTIEKIDELFDVCKFLDYSGRAKPKKIKEAINTVKKFRKKLESYEIDLEELEE